MSDFFRSRTKYFVKSVYIKYPLKEKWVTHMSDKYNTVDGSNSSDKQTPNSAGFRRFGKKLYALIAVVAVVIIAVALLVPQGVAAIPLNADYVVGEKMIYDSKVTVTMEFDDPSLAAIMGQTPNSVSVDATENVEVVDFDGEYYTLNRTTTMNLNTPPLNSTPISVSMIEKMNKTGYSTYLINIGDTTQALPDIGSTGNSYLVQLLNKPEVKVGDSITVPYPALDIPGMQVTGDLTVTFGEIEELTTPAGTYRVFKIEMTSNNIQITFNTPAAASSSPYIPTDITMNSDMNYQVYLEYGTLRQIKADMQQTSIFQSSLINYTSTTTTETTLNQHIKP